MKTKEEIVENWLPRYTGQPLEAFGDYVLLTNFIGYLEKFCALTGASIVDRERPMPCAMLSSFSAFPFSISRIVGDKTCRELPM